MKREVLDAALAYAANGWPVLALYGTTDAGCDCGEVRCKSPGKHPRPDLSPAGVHSATTDPSIIATWDGEYNIGIALGSVANGLLVFDIDDTEIARALLHPSVMLSDQTGVVVSGRGAHVYFRSMVKHHPFDVSTIEGKKIGGVRGDGQYVAAPPSRHLLRPYKWQNMPSTWIPFVEVTDNPIAYVTSLLRMVDIEIETPGAPPVTPGEGEDELLDACYLPEELRQASGLVYTKQMLSGTLNLASEPDRSGKMFRIAKEINERAKSLNISITRKTLAGIVMNVDQLTFGNRYAGHPEEYWRIARKVLPEGDFASGTSTMDDPPMSTPTPTQTTSGDYAWDSIVGELYISRGKQSVTIANFLPHILSDNEIEANEGVERSWHVRFTKGDGRSIEFIMPSEAFSGMNKLEKIVRKFCPADIIIAAGGYRHLIPAMQQLSEGITVQRKVPSSSGWLEYGPDLVYLLPSATGAITRDKMDTTIRIDPKQLKENSTILHASLAPYGKGVRPPETQKERTAAIEAFLRLLSCADAGVTVPVVLQVLAGPLASLGVGVTPPLVHVTGQTGTLKTSFSLCAISIFGTFSRGTPAPMSWTSTANAIGGLLYTCKDLTVLIDDYKTSVAQKARGVAGTTSMIQNYADRTGRLRMSADQEIRQGKVSRALILSNGEDVWEGEASAAARTVIVRIHEGDVRGDRLAKVQDAIDHGHLQLFGGMYLQWLAGQEDILSGKMIQASRAAWAAKLKELMPKMHLRLPETASSLMAAGDVLLRFLATVAPERIPLVQACIDRGLASIVISTKDRAREVEDSSPVRQVARKMMDDTAARLVCIRPAAGKDPDRQTIPPGATDKFITVAYWKEDDEETRWVWFTKDATYSWFQKEGRKTGDDIGFSWSSFMDECVTQFSGERFRNARAHDKGKLQLSGVRIKLDDFYAVGGSDDV